jgi:hypothetical protein
MLEKADAIGSLQSGFVLVALFGFPWDRGMIISTCGFQEFRIEFKTLLKSSSASPSFQNYEK